MPVIRRAMLRQEQADPAVSFVPLIGDDVGAGYVTMSEVTIAPGASTSLHIHPTHEEAIYVMDGDLEFELGDERGVLRKGDALLAPPGVAHRLSNPGKEPRRVMAVFPTTNVRRQVLEPAR